MASSLVVFDAGDTVLSPRQEFQRLLESPGGTLDMVRSPFTRLFTLAAALLIATSAVQAAPPAKVDPAADPVPNWLWAGPAKENQTVAFRVAVDLPKDGKPLKSASLWTTCDNDVTVFVNGKRAGNNPIWQVPATLNIKSMLEPGHNVIAFAAKNENSEAGFIAKLQIKQSDGKTITIVSDDTWRGTADKLPTNWAERDFNDSGWTKPRVIGKYGIGPWDKLPREGIAGPSGKATPAENLTLLPGFKAELLYSVPKEKEDSWVCMTTDPKGRIIVSGQNGPLFRVTVGAKPEDTKVAQIDIPLGFAQGLLWAHDALYVTVNGGGIAGNSNGVYRVTDTNGDDKLDKVETLIKFNQGTGEHGPHALRLGPDGKIYLTAGNFTGLPDDMDFEHSPKRNWAEDLLLPRNPDGGGHDPHIMAPGGWIIRFDKDGKHREVVLSGLRNTYDFDFNPAGELLLYDSDMEWDTGTPWYRPTRVLLGVSGGEYGWRNGTGKWPDYYPDSLGAVVNTGLGSPTGVTFGTLAKFPAKYQHAMFAADWAYGNLYAVHLAPQGAGYRATFEKFIVGKPFDITDVIINPADGAMYITIGGRNTQSGLYRVTYAGTESTAKVAEPEDKSTIDARATRHKIEAFHVKQDPASIDFLWPFLDSPDRYLRFAARVAIERQPLNSWKQRALDERSPTASINALVALIRAGSLYDGQRPDKTVKFKPNPELLKDVLDALGELPIKSLAEEQTLEAMRTLGLAFARLGSPEDSVVPEITGAVDQLYPSQSTAVNREASQLLAYLQAPSVVPKTMKLLAAATTQEDQLHYVLVIRGVKAGWTPELRKAYFSWINLALNKYAGGHSFKNFLLRIRQDAVATLTDDEKKQFEPFLKGDQKVEVVQDTKPRQFVKNWQMADLLPVIDRSTSGRDFVRGKAAFEAAQCAKCHRFANDGGSTGPDLTGVGNRFQPADVLESILLPSKVISDQYRPTEFITKQHTLVSGQVEAEDADTLTIRANPLSTETVKLKKSDVAKQRPARLSLMPEGLVDTFSQDEILDMIAYLRSAGNKDDKAFAKN
jgi:putative heme-binding domain-containing protein